MGSFNISVTQHRTLNSSRGVISESDLISCSDEEIHENLKDQGVIAVRRITIRRDGKILPTKHVIITFDTPSLPSSVTAAYLKCHVRPYVPNPLRCFKCQRFGHAKDSCRGNTTCAKCARSGHESDSCEEEPCCVNCKGNHPAFSRSCPKWTTEKEIQTVKVTRNVSFSEARRIIENRTPTPGLSYAAAISTKTMKSATTQTEPVFFIPTRMANKTPEQNKNSQPHLATSSQKNTLKSAQTTTKYSLHSGSSSPAHKNVMEPKQSCSYHVDLNSPIPPNLKPSRTSEYLELEPNRNRSFRALPNIKSQQYKKNKILVERNKPGLTRKHEDTKYLKNKNLQAPSQDTLEMYTSGISDTDEAECNDIASLASKPTRRGHSVSPSPPLPSSST